MWVLFEMKAWVGTEYYLLEGEDIDVIVHQILRENDLYCIARMGRSMGTKDDQPQLNRIDKFLEKFDQGELTWDDISKFNFKLSTGSFRCLGIASDPKNLEKLKKKAGLNID